MENNRLLADLNRALDLVDQIDESQLDFPPDPTVSDDVQKLTGIDSYPTDSHRDNVKARMSAVRQAGDMLQPRDASGYISKLIVACVRLAPPSDD